LVGVYHLHLEARLAVRPDQRPVPVGSGTVTFAVGVDPHDVSGIDAEHVLHGGHADITVDLDDDQLYLFADPHGGGERTQERFDATTTVIEVPNKALLEVPPDPGHRFLGRAGELIHQLPQAVLGRHVHGEIDPHLWHDVGNTIAYVKLIRDSLIDVDPAGATGYRSNAAVYTEELEALDDQDREVLSGIPPERRHLVTTHDAFAYLAAAYDLQVSGFVTPDPSAEPSLADRRRLTETVRNLDIPAVFLEPNLVARSSTLTEVARAEGVEVCPILGDAFGPDVEDYVEMVRFNAASLRRCLGP